MFETRRRIKIPKNTSPSVRRRRPSRCDLSSRLFLNRSGSGPTPNNRTVFVGWQSAPSSFSFVFNRLRMRNSFEEATQLRKMNTILFERLSPRKGELEKKKKHWFLVEIRFVEVGRALLMCEASWKSGTPGRNREIPVSVAAIRYGWALDRFPSTERLLHGTTFASSTLQDKHTHTHTHTPTHHKHTHTHFDSSDTRQVEGGTSRWRDNCRPIATLDTKD